MTHDVIGGAGALDRLIEEHLPAMLRFATRLTGDPAAAEEIVQETLLRVARGWRVFRREAHPRTWLFQVIVNVSRSRVRKARADERLPAELADLRAVDPVATAELNELRALVADAVSRLPDRQREVFVLLTYESFAASDVAEMLGMTVANVHATRHVARNRLRELLAPYLDMFVEKPDGAA